MPPSSGAGAGVRLPPRPPLPRRRCPPPPPRPRPSCRGAASRERCHITQFSTEPPRHLCSGVTPTPAGLLTTSIEASSYRTCSRSLGSLMPQATADPFVGSVSIVAADASISRPSFLLKNTPGLRANDTLLFLVPQAPGFGASAGPRLPFLAPQADFFGGRGALVATSWGKHHLNSGFAC